MYISCCVTTVLILKIRPVIFSPLPSIDVFNLINITSAYEHQGMIQQYQGPLGSNPNKKTKAIASSKINLAPNIDNLVDNLFSLKSPALRLH